MSSQKAQWRRFVEQRRRELHDAHPCGAPTRRRVCPKHRKRVGPVTGICKPCRDELYEKLAAEYTSAAQERQKEESTMTDVNTEPIEGELLPDVLEKPAAPGLFGTDDPELVVAKAVDVSNVLKRVIRDRKLYASINGKEHVLVGGWTLLGSMLGVYPATVWSHRLEDGWEARVEARTRDGALVGAAESECLRSEHKWAKADDYAIRSMAQTRATSKALRLPLGFVMELAGFDATPADEMPAEPAKPPEPRPEPVPRPWKPRDDQWDEIRTLIRSLKRIEPSPDWKQWCLERSAPSDRLTTGQADILIEQLRGKLAELAGAGGGDDVE